MTEQEQREYNDSHAIATLVDDGCPHVDVTVPRRPFAGLRPKQAKQAVRDTRKFFTFMAAVHVELQDGVYVEANKAPELWSAQAVKLPDGTVFGTVLTVFINTIPKEKTE